MKKLLYIFAAAALTVLAAGCAKEMRTPAPSGDTVSATFTVGLPGTVASKAIADGESAVKLSYYVYDQNGTYLPNLLVNGDTEHVVTVTDKKATVVLDLVKGLKYSFVFIAYNEDAFTDGSDEVAYKYTPADKTLAVDYAKASTNDEKFDLFTAAIVDKQVDGDFTEGVTLKRPFAQVNFGTTEADLSAAANSGIEIDDMLTKLTFTELGSQYNVLEETVSGTNATNVTVPAAIVPARNSEDLVVDGNNYEYVSTAYVLVPGDGKQTVDVDLDITLGGNLDNIQRSVANVPVQKNYRTNIVGKIFTGTATFNITVDQNFEDAYTSDDNQSDYTPTYATIGELNNAFAAGSLPYTVTLDTPEDGTIKLPDTSEDVSIRFMGNFSEKSITIQYADTPAAYPANLTLYAENLGTLNANLPQTHIELASNSQITNKAVVGSNTTTFVVNSNASIKEVEIIMGSLKVEQDAEVETATVKAEAGAEATTVIEGKVENLTIEAGSLEITATAAVEELVIDNASGAVGEIVIDENANVDEEPTIPDTVPVMNPDQKEFYDQITAEGTAIVQMTEDVELPKAAVISGNITLDLNGHTLSNSSKTTIPGGLLQVKRGATLAIKDGTATSSTVGDGKIIGGSNAYGAVQVTVKDDNDEETATLNVTGGTIEGYYYGIVGNGSRHNTAVKITKGTVQATAGPAIFHPQEGTLTVNGKYVTITGVDAGIEMRAGTLTVSSATVTATAESFKETANGSGSTIEGAAIAVSQHTTNKPLSVTLTSGTYNGIYAVYEKDLQDSNVEGISLALKAGTYNGGVYSQNCTKFVTGGMYKNDPTDYLADSYRIIPETTYRVEKYVVNDNVTAIADIGSGFTTSGNYTLAADLTGRFAAGVVAGTDVTINLNNHSITSDSKYGTFNLRGSMKLTINGEGQVIDTNAEGRNVWAASTTTNTCTVTINGGTFRSSNSESIYAEAGTIYIYGGTFMSSCEGDRDGNGNHKFLLNCKDANRNNKDMNQNTGKAKILVYGGKFYDFNPANCAAEGEGTNFVATGYKSVQRDNETIDGVEHKVWEVVPDEGE